MKLNENYILVSIFILGLSIKLLLFPITHTVDCDAVSRIFLSMQWYENPYWITNSVWLPFHFYLNSFAFWLYNDWEHSIIFLNIFLSSLSIFPFYHFVRKEFNPNGAIYSCILFIVSPVLFRNSFLAMSETPFWFFIILSLYLVSKGIQEKKSFWIFAAGISLTFAGAFRYEAWLLTPLLASVIAFKKQWKFSFVFLLPALIFPALWIYYSLSYNGTIFHPGSPVLSAEVIPSKEFDWESWARKIWFYPLSWILTVGPISSFFLLKYMRKRIAAEILQNLLSNPFSFQKSIKKIQLEGNICY